MKRTYLILLTLVFSIINLFGQTEITVKLETETGKIEGTLLVPDIDPVLPVALIIAGSGPTDRDGNNIQMKNNSLKMLAEGLADNGIASLRYDKRGVGKSFSAGMKEIDLRFDMFVEDAKGWIDWLDRDDRFKQIIVIGHSEGSLIGLIASQKDNVDMFVSLAGAGDAAGSILRRQLAEQPPKILEDSEPIISSLENGILVDTVPKSVLTLFRPSVQPYIISWFKYNPQQEIAKLDIPILIIQGTTDIQITKDDSDKLAAAKPEAEYLIIEGMNHVLKEAPPERLAQLGTYYKPDIPLKDGLIVAIVDFIKKVTSDE